jgi:iron complex outermembrane recepter protein
LIFEFSDGKKCDAGARRACCIVIAGVVFLTLGASPRANAQASSSSGATNQASSGNNMEEIVVTARKRTESIINVPTSITMFGPEAIKDYDIQSFADYATKVPNLNFSTGQDFLSVTNSLSIAIRGVSGQNTTGFYIDDTQVPVTVNARVIDIERIETLKGPQGTLFGAASMGGNVRLISKQADLANGDGTLFVQGGGTSGGGSPDYGGSAVGTFIVIPDTLSIRAMAFYQHDSGYLTNTFPSATGTGRDSLGNQGEVETYGGSITARWKVSDRFEATFRVLDQQVSYSGLQEAYAPLPAFLPNYILNRTVDLPENAINNFALPSLVLKYHTDAFTLTSAASYFYNQSIENENGTEGTVEAIQQFYSVNLNPLVPIPAQSINFNNQWTEEARVSATLSNAFSVTGGVYYSRQWAGFEIPHLIVPGLANTGLYSTDLLLNEIIQHNSSQAAIFGELYYKFLQKFTLTLGGRFYKLKQAFDQNADGFFNGGPSDSGNITSSQSGFSPKVALSYATGEQSNVYASYASGFRPGGSQIPPPSFCAPGGEPVGNLAEYNSDKIDTTELGFKSEFLERRAYFTAAVFQSLWKNMQQTVVLPCTYGITTNTGEARIRGAEFELDGEVAPNLQLRTGIGLLDPVITDPGSGSFQEEQRINQVPKFNGTLGLQYSFPHVWQGRPYIGADYSYIGDRYSQNNTGLKPLVEPAYSVFNMNAGIQFNKSEVSLYFKNIANAKPNLGDVQQIAFSQTVPGLGGTSVPYLEVALLRPFNMGLQYTYRF